MTDPTVTVDDHVDIIEASEMLGFLAAWMAQSPPTVAADFERYAWPCSFDQMRQDLAALASKLAGNKPTPPQP